MNEKRFTLKQNGKYFSAIGCKTGFFAHGIAGCYSYDWSTVQHLQAMVGGKIVEVVHVKGWHYEEREICES